MDLPKSIAVPVVTRGTRRAKLVALPALNPELRIGGLLADPRRGVPAAAEPLKSAFQVGQRLRLRGGGNSLMRAASMCQVVQVMPHESGPFLYRVRSELEQFERIVSEVDLAVAE